MPKAYSDDLRWKLLKAYTAGRGGLEKLAEQFGVSYGYCKKIRRQQLATGQAKRPAQQRHGPVGSLSEEIKRFSAIRGEKAGGCDACGVVRAVAHGPSD